MITITIYQNQEQVAQGFRCIGHAGYANVGEDIVCSAVSVLVINTINSIEVYTDAEFDIETEEETGLIAFRFITKMQLHEKRLCTLWVITR